jgi:hypothetical protein
LKSFSFILLILVCLFPKNVFAYPHYIGLGYKSCITCHYNPFGNGPVNDYGRAVAGTAIGSRDFYSDNKTEDEIANESGFFFRKTESKFFRPFIGYRGMYLKSNLGNSNSSSTFINMQVDANAVLRWGSKDQFLLSGSFGYAPIPRSMQNTTTSSSMKEYRSREYYLGWRPKAEIGFYFGLMDKPFGIRVAEHTSYSRTTPELNMNDQAHGFVVHYAKDKIEGGLDLFLGNLSSDKSVQTKGLSGIFEYTIFEKHRIGFSVLTQKNDYQKMTAAALHSRMEITGANSLLFEYGYVTKQPVTGSWKTSQQYSLIQNHIRMRRGYYFLNSLELLKTVESNSSRYRIGPGIQFFPYAKTEFRIDLYNTRYINKDTSSNDRWDLMTQLHLWF